RSSPHSAADFSDSLRCVVLPSATLAFFFFTATATPEIYTLSLHDALPICLPGLELVNQRRERLRLPLFVRLRRYELGLRRRTKRDRKSTRLNSSHVKISYAVFCLKKKKKVRN